MNVTVDIQFASTEPVPRKAEIRGWVAAALARTGQENKEISMRLVDIDEMTSLNRTYCGKPGPTNVLSFPSNLPAAIDLPLLGDIVICAPVVRAEAAEQDKSIASHWAHMTVHGTLHLLGYDHIDADDASAMEALESLILADLNYPCPYRSEPIQEHSQG